MEKYSADNSRFQMRAVNSTLINFDPEYQRKLDWRRVRKIASKFAMERVNAPKISYRDGKYYCFDGMHTIHAINAVCGGKPTDILCCVYNDMTKEDEAYWFSHQDDERKAVKVIDRFKASVVAKEEAACRVNEIINSYGINITSGGNADWSTRAVSTFTKMYNAYGEAHFLQIMDLIIRTWHGSYESLTGKFIEGVNRFYCKYSGNKAFSIRDFINRVGKHTAQEILAESKKFNNRKAGFDAYLIDLYNKGCRIRLE